MAQSGIARAMPFFAREGSMSCATQTAKSYLRRMWYSRQFPESLALDYLNLTLSQREREALWQAQAVGEL
jgi:hypothetical protein